MQGSTFRSQPVLESSIQTTLEVPFLENELLFPASCISCCRVEQKCLLGPGHPHNQKHTSKRKNLPLKADGWFSGRLQATAAVTDLPASRVVNRETERLKLTRGGLGHQKIPESEGRWAQIPYEVLVLNVGDIHIHT